MVGAGLTSIAWGAFSDRYGKKLVIMIGLVANTAPQVFFGMATSMPTALSMRLIMGLFNGLVGAAKALAPELVPPTEQASAMSMIAATWGLGNLVGPAIGGLLSMYGLCEAGNTTAVGNASEADIVSTVGQAANDNTSCPHYPFILPNLVCAALSLVALVAVKRVLPCDRRRTAGRVQPDVAKGAALAPAGSSAVAVAEHSRAEEKDTAALRSKVDAIASDAGDPDDTSRKARQPLVLSQRQLATRGALLVAFYGGIALNDIIHNEAFPLWCVAPVEAGGLGLDSTMLGTLLSISGAALLFFQMVLFPPLSRRVSITRLCLMGTAASGGLYALLPFVTIFRERRLVFAARAPPGLEPCPSSR